MRAASDLALCGSSSARSTKPFEGKRMTKCAKSCGKTKKPNSKKSSRKSTRATKTGDLVPPHESGWRLDLASTAKTLRRKESQRKNPFGDPSSLCVLAVNAAF